jgi:hypothetical protein
MDILFEEMNKLLDRGFCGASSCVHAVGPSGVLVFSPSLSRKNVEKSPANCNELTHHPWRFHQKEGGQVVSSPPLWRRRACTAVIVRRKKI